MSRKNNFQISESERERYELEQDLEKQVEPREIPPVIAPLPNASKIKKVIWDADNTFWDWTRMRTQGIESMAGVVSEQLQIPIEETRRSMGRAFDAADTFDHPAVIENMDVVIEKLLNDYHGWKKDPEKGVIMVMKIIAQVLWAAGKAYNSNRSEHYGLYADIRTVLRYVYEYQQEAAQIRQKIFDQFVFTNAPRNKITPRLKHFDLLQFFSAIYTVPAARVNYKLSQVNFGGVSKAIHERYKEILEKVAKVDKEIEDRFEPVMRGLKYYTADVPERVLYDIKKPSLSLAELWGMTAEEVSESVVIIGDSYVSDMKFAMENRCVGLNAKWGWASKQDEEVIACYESKSAKRNVPDPKETEAIKKEIKKEGHQIEEVDDPIQILDLLGIERPEGLKPKNED